MGSATQRRAGEVFGAYTLINYLGGGGNAEVWRASQDPPWLAMPVATPLRGALGSAPAAEAVVSAMAAVAATLASLHASGISHRDIKPDNLYHDGERWLVGDFGLVDGPNVEPLTDGASLRLPARTRHPSAGSTRRDQT